MKRVLVIAIAALASGCVTTKIMSNKARDFNEKFDRLFIAVKTEENSKGFLAAFTNEFKWALQERGVTTGGHFSDPLSLETESDIEEKIEAFNPGLVMEITQTDSYMISYPGHWSTFGQGSAPIFHGGGSSSGKTFDIKIFRPGSEKPVWRSSIKTDGMNGFEASAKKLSEKFVEKLIEDGLL